jgi:hypothetical protein
MYQLQCDRLFEVVRYQPRQQLLSLTCHIRTGPQSKMWTSGGMQILWQIELHVVLLDVFSVAVNRDHGSAVTGRRLDHVTIQR